MDRTNQRILSFLIVLASGGVAISLAIATGTDRGGRVNILAGAGVFVFALATLLGIVMIFLDSYRTIASVLRDERRESAIARQLCPTCGYDVRANEERCSECGEPLPKDWNQPAQTPALRRLIRTAVAEAKAAGSDHAGTQHLLLAVLHEPGSAGAVVLENLGITDQMIRAELASLISNPETRMTNQ